MKVQRLPIFVFKSRLGKRLFWTFVGCSFLPLIILAALSYAHVREQLHHQTAARLKQTTKGVGLSIYERLELVEAEIHLIAQTMTESLPESGLPVNLAGPGSGMPRFDGLSLTTASGRRVDLQGHIEQPPSISASEKAHLRNGKPLVQVIPRDGRPARILMRIGTPGDTGILTAEVNAAFLWGIGQQYNLPPLTELTIMAPSGRALISSLPDAAPLFAKAVSPQRDTATHQFVWQTADGVYLASYWDLFLKSRFGADTWTIVLSQTREDALEPLRSFKVNFPLVLLVGFWIVLLVSIRFIRKSLDPLEKLRGATQRIQDGDFSQSVAIRSGDEFEDLAVSFNVMTAKLARTFGELSVMAQMGHVVTSRHGVVDLAMTELDIMQSQLHFDWGLLMLEEHILDGAPFAAGYGFPQDMAPGSQTVVRIDREAEWLDWMTAALQHHDLIFSNHIDELESVLPPPGMAFLKRMQCRSLICAPIVFESTRMGILAVGNHGRSDLTDSDQHLLIGIAAQTAVAVNSLMTFRKLEESEARFREAFEHAATGIALADPDGRIRVSNRYLQHMLGCSEAELAHRTIEDITWPEDRTNGEEVLAPLIAGRQRFVQVEKRLCHNTGEAVWTRMNGSLMRDQAGRPLQFIFHIRDLAAEKAAEADKQRLERQLRQAQKMEAIGTLAGGIAHDFNNILSAVGGYTELSLMQLPPDAEVRDHLEKVKGAADRATDLVQQILAFSRQSENEKIVLQIGSIVKEALQLLRASLPSTIEIRKAIETETGSIMADPTQIHQIVMNLCTNAMHAMQTGGGILDVRLKQVSLSMEAARARNLVVPGDYVQLTVADTGGGMDPRTRDRIFDPYFTTKAKGKGTGLGLAVVHGIVESYRGAIAVASEPGKGTRFDVIFPVTDRDNRPVDTAAEEDFSGRERVLFVDDEPMLVDLGRTILTKQGYRVTGMTDPREALAVFRKAPDRFDIVITDLTMPGLPGDRLAEAIAAVRPDVPILLCSGYVQHGNHPCLAGTIHKPLHLQALSRAVREALDQGRSSSHR